jgi:putative DNA primase/helicase
LSVEIGHKNLGTWFDWSTDDGGDMFDLIKHVKGCDFNEAKRIAREITGTSATASKYSPRSRLIYPDDNKPDPGTTKYAGQLWDEGLDPRGTIVETYLRSRKLEIADDIAISVVRYHRPFYCAGRTAAAMIALFRDIKTDEPCGVSITLLDKNVGKIDRRFYGHVGKGAIKFCDATNILNIGEGIESTLSGLAMGYAPVWCVGSAGSIARFPVVAGVTSLYIFGEKGDGGANTKAMKKATAGWRHSGADIFVVEPKVGNDLNDAWRAEVAS